MEPHHGKPRGPRKKKVQDFDDLCEALCMLETPQEARAFMSDLCTQAELSAMSERYKIAKLLLLNNLPYREIAKQTGASTTTIGRVASFLFSDQVLGYETLIRRQEQNNENDQNQISITTQGKAR